jgi:hypothetical protein
MSTGGARRGRRDNGLVAAAYAVAGDVDPRVGEHLLDVLALRGIAAYLQPAADLHPVTRTTTLPSRPTDRLYVDRAHLDTARSFIAQLAPEGAQATATAEPTGPQPTATQPGGPQPAGPQPAEPDLDDLFAGIVAGYDAEVEGASWPAAEDVSDKGAEPDSSGHAGAPSRTTLPRWHRSTITPEDDRSSLLDGLDTFGADLEGDDDEGYTPPPPPPLPRLAPATIAAVAAILVGVLLLFDPGLLPIDNTAAMALGLGGILAGFIALIWRLRSGDDDDDWDPDDGAVV